MTDDDVLARDGFAQLAGAILVRGRDAVALHLRGHRTSTRVLHDLAVELAHAARAAGATLLVNDRVDVALAVQADGVQLGEGSLPTEAVRSLGDWRWVGFSAHNPEQAARAAADGTDFVLLGMIYPTPSHPDADPGGIARVRATVARVNVPVIAIGGVTPARIGELVDAGAYGVAVVSGIWNAADPLARLDHYLTALTAAASRQRSNHAEH